MAQPALLPQLGVLAQHPQGALFVSPTQAGYPIPTTPLQTLRDFLGFSFDHIYAPLMDRLNTTTVEPGDSPEFKKAAQDWATYMNYYRNVVNP